LSIPLHQQLNDRLYVITGGPGAGKTAILHELQRRGFACVPEAARQIIQEQVNTGGNAVLWLDTGRYTSLMLKKSVEDYLAHSGAAHVTFFDRGILDTITHARIHQLRLSEEAYSQAQTYRYHRKVFLAPPWQQIYSTDAERKQTFEEALVSFRRNKEVYTEYGYDLVEIPMGTVEARVDFILTSIQSDFAARQLAT
jgi:predicted ATPase